MDIAKFFDREKRELSSNSSVNEAAAKKQHEKSLNDSMGLDNDDVFATGLTSSECVKLLFNCLQNLETEMKNVKEISLAAKKWQIKCTEQLNEMNSAITFINEKFVECEKEIKNNNEEIKSLKKENSYLTKRPEEVDAVFDRQQQYSSRNCLSIHGIDEVEGEDTDELSIKIIEEHMNQKIKPEDIDRSHRLGNPRKSIKAKLRPIIVKFVRYNTRNSIYRNEKLFKRKRDKGDGKFNCREV